MAGSLPSSRKAKTISLLILLRRTPSNTPPFPQQGFNGDMLRSRSSSFLRIWSSCKNGTRRFGLPKWLFLQIWIWNGEWWNNNWGSCFDESNIFLQLSKQPNIAQQLFRFSWPSQRYAVGPKFHSSFTGQTVLVNGSLLDFPLHYNFCFCWDVNYVFQKCGRRRFHTNTRDILFGAMFGQRIDQRRLMNRNSRTNESCCNKLEDSDVLHSE